MYAVMTTSETGAYALRKTRRRFEDWKTDGRKYVRGFDADEVISKVPFLEQIKNGDDTEIFPAVHMLFKDQAAVQWEYLDKCVFNKVMKTHKEKLQANGVDIGSSMIFASRIGTLHQLRTDSKSYGTATYS